MKKRMIAFFAMLLMMLSCIPVGGLTIADAAEDLIMKLHYHRPDNSYDGWTVWTWAAGMDGADYAFAEEDGEMVTTLTIAPGVTSVGFIVRTQDWVKDVDADQFIDIAEMVSGTVHIYVESGVEGYTKEYGDDAVIGVRLSKARFDGEKTIVATFTGKLEEDLNNYFTVTGPSGTVAIEKVEAASDTEYHVVLAEEINPSKSYKITCDGSEYNVVMPILFSTPKFEEEYTYTGNDLGATYTKEKTSFRVWAPTADSVTLNLYTGGTAGVSDLIEQIEMKKDVKGTWIAEKSGDLNGTYYTYRVEVGGKINEACDPYARTTGLNGNRAMVIDLSSTNPDGWDTDSDPNAGKNFNDAVIYELHVRDLSTSADSGITNKGKFLGLTETGTKSPSGIATGLDHIKELGVTHVHLLPIYDFGSVDEGNVYAEQFNWGYDPVNYNVPEGSYSTDPAHGEVRVKEMKQMVKSLHTNGISVIMDVVYNHVQNAGDFCFNKIVPMYFTRITEDGAYSNGSGCGNDTASERSMVKKYIVDSVKYWADEYHIDGFRFDLVGLLDTETVNEIVKEVHKDHPNVVFYGEGWTMNTEVTKPGYTMATQVNSTQTPDFAYFSDTIRDLLKGSVFDHGIGYVSGAQGLEAKLEKCFMGLSPDWCTTPAQTVNYASCHDNMTLIDRIAVSTPDESRENQIKMNNLSAAIYMTAEGIPFMQAGEEMLRTKVKADGSFDHNSYNSGDKINQLIWENLANDEYKQVYEYYKGLIAFRKAHGALRLTNAADVRSNVVPAQGLPSNVVAFHINGGVNGETADALYVIFNANKDAVELTLPEGKWNVYIDGEKAGTQVLKTIKNGKVNVEGISAMVLAQDGNSAAGGSNVLLIVSIAAVIIMAAAAGFVIISKGKKKGGKK